jgi:non-ribosomal peptide synthase protein (TIGR01720 family)
MQNAYVAPRNEAEKTIARVWEELLGVEPIGVDDNFFELGGDSVITIQAIARINQAGLTLSPRQVFEHQTVARLAEVAGTATAIEAEQGIVTGEAPLTPIQRWFFEQNLTSPHHYNQAVLLESRDRLDAATIAAAVERLLVHHDVLRARYRQNESGWAQEISAVPKAAPFTAIDLSFIPNGEHKRAIETAAAAVQSSLDLSDGPLLRAVLFNLGSDSPNRLLIVVHHLLIDAISWRFLLEDIQTAYRQLSNRNPVQLPAKTTSFKRWAEKMSDYAETQQVKEELSHWLRLSKEPPPRLPVNRENGANTVASARTVALSLDEDETRVLLQETPMVFQSQIHEVLLAALADAFGAWTGVRAILVDLEGHGRDAVFDDVDVSRTVGWFTAVYPVLVNLEAADDCHGALSEVKRSLQEVPNGGLSYGLLRFVNSDPGTAQEIKCLPHAEVSFLYLGQFDQVLSSSSPFGAARESAGLLQSPDSLRSHLLAISGLVAEGRLELAIQYSENVHHRATIEQLGEAVLTALRGYVGNSRAGVVQRHKPSDFPDAELTQSELDDLIAQLSDDRS